MANITTMYYEDALKQNLMTQLKFKEIPSASSPTGSLFINDIQPVIVLEEPAGTIASEEKEEVVEKTPKSFSERFQEVAKKTSKTNNKQQLFDKELAKKIQDKLEKLYPEVHWVELTELLIKSTQNDPADRPTIEEFRNSLVKYLKVYKDYMKQDLSQYN